MAIKLLLFSQPIKGIWGWRPQLCWKADSSEGELNASTDETTGAGRSQSKKFLNNDALVACFPSNFIYVPMAIFPTASFTWGDVFLLHASPWAMGTMAGWLLCMPITSFVDNSPESAFNMQRRTKLAILTILVLTEVFRTPIEQSRNSYVAVFAMITLGWIAYINNEMVRVAWL